MNKKVGYSSSPWPQLATRLAYLTLLVGCSSTQKTAPHSRQLTPHSMPHFVCKGPSKYQGKVIGDGHCVTLIKTCSGAPNTQFWRPGPRVIEQVKLKEGTVIATFKGNVYPNKTGWHAAIYIKHSPEGIWVWDQWKGKPVHKRLIRHRNDEASAGNTAQNYRVVTE